MKEFRPPMSEVVESLNCLLQRINMRKSNGADGAEVESAERSFRSSNSRFIGSPTLSHLSV